MPDLDFALRLSAPESTLAVGGLVLLMLGAFMGEKSARLISILSVAVLVAATAVTVTGPLGMAFNGAYVADPLAVYGKALIFLSSAVAIVLGDGWMRRARIAKFEYPVLIVLASAGMGMMASSGDLISLYVGIELHSLALYVLAAYHRDDLKASEAGLKYFVLGALSSGLLLYGASLIYGFTGSMRFDEIAAYAAANESTGLIFGLVFLICGLAFKVSAAPFHMWTPDVYEGAPTPLVGFFAAAPKLAAMVLLARVLQEGFGGAVEQWRQVILAIALLSVFVGAFAGLAQKNLKRLWAYSSIANIGYALIGLAAGGEAGVQAMLMFMVLYMVDVTGFFACMTALRRDGRQMETIDDMAGLFKEKPGIALAMTAFSLSALGLPPLVGFFGKYYVFKAAIDAGLAWAAIIALVGSVVAAFYYLRLIKVMWFDAAPGSVEEPALSAQSIAIGAALFSFPVGLVALVWLDPVSRAAAAVLG